MDSTGESVNKLNQTQTGLSFRLHISMCVGWAQRCWKQNGAHRREEETLRVEEDAKREMECIQQESRREEGAGMGESGAGINKHEENDICV